MTFLQWFTNPYLRILLSHIKRNKENTFCMIRSEQCHLPIDSSMSSEIDKASASCSDMFSLSEKKNDVICELSFFQF